MILWAPVAWYPGPLQILRPLDPADYKKLRPYEEQELSDVWEAADDEWLLVRAKLRPAIVVSPEDEHRRRGAARLLPMYSVKDAYLNLAEKIQNQEIPNMFWLDKVPVDVVAQPQVVDCAKAVRLPIAWIQNRRRIALLDSVTLLAIKQFWRESILP